MSLNDERWLPIMGYEGLYEVSDMGRIKSVRSRTNTKVGYVLSPIRLHHSYSVRLSKDGKATNKFVHRLVADAFIGAIPDGHEVNHMNRDTSDNRLVNLEYVTPLQNTRHAIENGGRNTARGERSAAAKLTDDDVRAIRKRSSAGESQWSIAMTYGIDRSSVSHIIHRQNWAHVS